MELFNYTDVCTMDETRIPRADHLELQEQMNCNHDDSEFMETWFDGEIPVCHVTVIDEDEFFNRYFGENYDC